MPIIRYKVRVIAYMVILAAISAYGIFRLSGCGRWPFPSRLNPRAASAVYIRNLGPDAKVYVIETRSRLEELYETMKADVPRRSSWLPGRTNGEIQHLLTLLDDQGNVLADYEITETGDVLFDRGFCECEKTLELLESWAASGIARELTKEEARELFDASGE